MNALPIRSFCKTGSGGTPARSKRAEYYEGGTIPWIKSGELERSTVASAEEFITKKGLAESSAKLLEPGAILIAMYGATVGQVSRLAITASTNQAICHIYPDEEVCDPDYLYRVLKGAKNRLLEKRVGGGQPNISQKIVRELEIPLPSLAEQKRIAGILDAADALRAKRRESLAQLDTLLQSTFLDMFGDPVTNPMGWEEQPFEEIVSDTKLGLVRSSKEFGWDYPMPYVRMDAVTLDGKFFPEKVQSTDATEKEAEAFALRPGDFLFNTRNSKELVGKACVFPGPDGWLFNNNLMRIRFKGEIEPSVIATQFQFRRVQRELEQRKSGTTSVFAVYWKSLRTLPVLVPPFDLQRRFAGIVETVEQQKARLHAHLAELDALFASLQSRAFSGEL